jgi:Zn-dependent M28 family amino/carboxypeptidase
MIMRRIHLLSIFIILSIAGCKSRDNVAPAVNSINTEDLKKYISVLASDDFGGRAPATEGERKTINYLAEEFGKLGLKPANNGSWFQEVSMLKITADQNMQLDLSGGKSKLNLKFKDDFIGGSPMTSNEINIDKSDMIFVGYGINAPEWNWNDYDGIDVKGKTVVIMVNDPGYATADSALFTGRSMTYYGRWTYKYEEAARQGAKAALIIHETGAAGYPWAVVQNSWSGPQFYLEDNDFIHSDLRLKGWVTGETARKIFEASGKDFEKLTAEASKRGFRAMPLGLKLSTRFGNQVENVKSNNVAALWPGDDRKDEYVIYTAHWDHFGINPTFSGDSILNGAVDNATGVAALLEIAKAFTSLPESQSRSILFLSVTGEEQGLLGSEYYANHPIFPLAKTVADINMDALNIFGPAKDMTIIGYGNSELDSYAEEVLKKYNRYAIPDPTPEKGGYFRSDHFSLARKGLPSLYLSRGVDNVEHGKEWGLKQSEQWIQENYHKPSDNYEPDKWNFDGMTDDIKVYFETGYRLSMTDAFPGWKAGFPFKSLRDRMMNP